MIVPLENFAGRCLSRIRVRQACQPDLVESNRRLALRGHVAGRFHFDPVQLERRRALDPHHRDLAESFLEAGRTQALGHLPHDLVAHHAFPAAIALHADFQRNVEEDGLHFIAKALGHLDPLAAFVGRRLVAST